MSTVCPPDAYQHEPNAPAHRHDERCRPAHRPPYDRAAELEGALRRIATADPDAPGVESWKWLAREFMRIANEALEATR